MEQAFYIFNEVGKDVILRAFVFFIIGMIWGRIIVKNSIKQYIESLKSTLHLRLNNYHEYMSDPNTKNLSKEWEKSTTEEINKIKFTIEKTTELLKNI